MTNIEQVTNRHIAKLMYVIEEETGMDEGEVIHDLIAKNVRREMHRLAQDVAECFNPHYRDNVIDTEIPLIPEGLKR